MQYLQFLSYFLCFVSLILLTLILIAGANKHVLVDYFFLKANTAALSIPAALSNSTFLKDISSVTGNDLVGPDTTASSLGLADSYTIFLFTSCAEQESCTSPRSGYHFNPITDLKLDDTAIQGSFSSSFLHSLSSYGTTSTFLAVAYLLAFVFTFVTPIFTLFSSRSPRAAFIGATTSILATGFLLAASSAALAIFKKVQGTFNDNLEPVGIDTALGNRLFIFSWVATVLSLVTSVLLCVHARRTSRGRKFGSGVINRRFADKGGVEADVGTMPRKQPGFLRRIPTWNRHKYSQIEKQPGVQTAITGKVYNENDRDVLLTRGFGGGDDLGDEHEELVHGPTRGIQLQDLGSGPSRDANTAYEPYRNQAGAGAGA